jgi:hypothetical protein
MPDVLRLRDLDPGPVRDLLARLGLDLVHLADPAAVVPGSYWGGAEAGLRGRRLFARPDTPVHSILHEASHFVCMSEARRRALDTDAGGDDEEELAVCVLQVLLAEGLPGVGRARMLADMDRWGYSFRLGSATRWWATDAEEGRRWLAERAVPGAMRATRRGAMMPAYADRTTV